MQKLFSGFEIAAIKLHGAIDVRITGNHVYRSSLGLWLDWMAQGTQLTRNLFHDNGRDVFCEVDHGPYLVANNIFLSSNAIAINSQGGAYAHNLIGGRITVYHFDSRQTPFLLAHSTEIAELQNNPQGDVRFLNNVFFGASLADLDKPALPVLMGGNVFLKGSQPSVQEKSPLCLPDENPNVHLAEQDGDWYLQMDIDKSWAASQARQLVTTATLGKTVVSNQPYENPDGSSIRIHSDYFGRPRDEHNPFPGPFEMPEGGTIRVKVWPQDSKG